MPTSKILVIGAGIAGINVAAAVAETGANVLIIEKEPWIGGRVMRVARYFPKFCPPSCGMEINTRRLFENSRIEVMTNTTISAAHKTSDGWLVTLDTAAQYVSDACRGCGNCVSVCPGQVPNPFNLGLNRMSAIGFVHPNVRPFKPVVFREACPEHCNECQNVCPANAVDLQAEPVQSIVGVKTVVAATGWRPYDISALELYGAGKFENVIANVVMERLYSPDGPTKGKILKANGEPPRKVAFIQCAGSRDVLHLPYCSEVCCAASIKQASYLRAQLPDAEVTIYYIDRRTTGRNEEMLTDAISNNTCRFVKGKVGKIVARHDSLMLRVEDAQRSTVVEEEADLVVLALGMVPNAVDTPLQLPFTADKNGFIQSDTDIGLIVAGTSRMPLDVVGTVRDANCAAMDALICQGTL